MAGLKRVGTDADTKHIKGSEKEGRKRKIPLNI